MKNIYSERSQQISNLISLLPAQSCSMLRTLVDVFCWMLHLMRYIPTTEYRSVIFQLTSPLDPPFINNLKPNFPLTPVYTKKLKYAQIY